MISIILFSWNILLIHLATGNSVSLDTDTRYEMPVKRADIFEDIGLPKNEEVTNCDYHRRFGSDDDTPMVAQNCSIILQNKRRARKKKRTNLSKSASKRDHKRKNDKIDRSSKSGKKHNSFRSSKSSKKIKKEKNKRMRSDFRNSYECSVETTDGCVIPIPNSHQTCLEEYWDLPEDQNFVTTRFHLTLVQEMTADILKDDIHALEVVVLEYFNHDFGSSDTEATCVQVIDAAFARKDNKGASGVTVVEAIAFYMEMDHAVEGDDESTRKKKKCKGADKALCCPTAINGKCSCCCKKCWHHSRHMDLMASISMNTNFHPIRMRYVIDGDDTRNVAKCAVNRFMEEAYDIKLSCADYLRDDCANNGGDPWDSNDIVCH